MHIDCDHIARCTTQSRRSKTSICQQPVCGSTFVHEYDWRKVPGFLSARAGLPQSSHSQGVVRIAWLLAAVMRCIKFPVHLPALSASTRHDAGAVRAKNVWKPLAVQASGKVRSFGRAQRKCNTCGCVPLLGVKLELKVETPRGVTVAARQNLLLSGASSTKRKSHEGECLPPHGAALAHAVIGQEWDALRKAAVCRIDTAMRPFALHISTFPALNQPRCLLTEAGELLLFVTMLTLVGKVLRI